MGWAIKYANIHELALRLVQAKGRLHTQKAFDDLREFISSENSGISSTDRRYAGQPFTPKPSQIPEHESISVSD